MPQATPPEIPGELPEARSKAVEALYAAGHWLYEERRIDDAVTVFRAVVRIAPQDERGWLALGACHEAQDRHDVALELYDQARRVAKSAPRCGLALARIFRARGMNDDASEAFAEAARLADDLGDDDLRALVAAERRRS